MLYCNVDFRVDEYLQQELEENPFLELRDEPEDEEVEDEIDEDIFEAEWLDYFQDRSDMGYTGPTEKDFEARRFDNLVTRAPNLHEHLLFQANITLPEADLAAAEFLIGCIDENGYLCVCTAEAAGSLGISEEQVERVLKAIQTFEPYGVGARSLPECLYIQLVMTGKNNPLAETIVKNYLQDWERKNGLVAVRLGISVQDVQKTMDLIRTLTPNQDVVTAVMMMSGTGTDIIVEKVEGEYVVQVDGKGPRLMVNKLYQNMLKQPGLFGAEAKNT